MFLNLGRKYSLRWGSIIVTLIYNWLCYFTGFAHQQSAGYHTTKYSDIRSNWRPNIWIVNYSNWLSPIKLHQLLRKKNPPDLLWCDQTCEHVFVTDADVSSYSTPWINYYRGAHRQDLLEPALSHHTSEFPPIWKQICTYIERLCMWNKTLSLSIYQTHSGND
jgi:hypothetical protein